jgi:hypothetical protein
VVVALGRQLVVHMQSLVSRAVFGRGGGLAVPLEDPVKSQE